MRGKELNPDLTPSPRTFYARRVLPEGEGEILLPVRV